MRFNMTSLPIPYPYETCQLSGRLYVRESLKAPCQIPDARRKKRAARDVLLKSKRCTFAFQPFMRRVMAAIPVSARPSKVTVEAPSGTVVEDSASCEKGANSTISVVNI